MSKVLSNEQPWAGSDAQPQANRASAMPGRVRPEVSVCVVNWNCRAELRACLESLLDQPQGLRLEVVVVDNGSSDGAADMVAVEFPEVVLVRNARNESFARANNQAVRHSRGRYLFFLNNDTIVPPYALRRLRDFARANPGAGLIGPKLVDAGGRAQLSARRFPTVGALLHRLSVVRWTGLFRGPYRRYRGRDEDGEATREVEVLMGAALFMPRAVFRDVGPWDEGYTFGGEDIDLCARVGARYKVLYHPGVSVTHLGRVSSRRNAGHAHTHTLVGITRQLRRAGSLPLGVLAYKAALTLDAPVQVVAQTVRGLWRQARGRTEGAAKCWAAARAWGHFLRHGVVQLWKA